MHKLCTVIYHIVSIIVVDGGGMFGILFYKYLSTNKLMHAHGTKNTIYDLYTA